MLLKNLMKHILPTLNFLVISLTSNLRNISPFIVIKKLKKITMKIKFRNFFYLMLLVTMK